MSWRLDRWGQSLVDLIATLQGADRAKSRVRLVERSPRPHDAKCDRAFAGMLAVVAEFERDILRDQDFIRPHLRDRLGFLWSTPL